MSQHHNVISFGFAQGRRLFSRKTSWWTRLWRYLSDTQ